jgi:hypothetical protein
MTLLTATLLVAAVAYRLATVLPLGSSTDRLLAAGVIATSQIAGSMLIAGAMLRSLRPGVVLLVNLAIAAAVFTLTWGRSRSFDITRPRVAAAWRAVRAHPWAGALVLLATLVVAWRLLVAYVYPSSGWDALAYHLTAVAGWLQHGRIGSNELHVFASSFPSNGELLVAWIPLFRHTDTWVDATQLPFAILGALAVAGLARMAGARGPAAAAGGALFVLAPIVQTQATSNYVDLFVAALFLAGLYFLCRAFGDESRGRPVSTPTYLVLSGCAGGLALGAKPTGVILATVLAVALVAGIIVRERRGGIGIPRARAVALCVVPMLVFGGFWYARNVIEHGNPVYPGEVRILGQRVFSGPGVALSAAPGGSEPVAILKSWGHDVTRIFHGSLEKYHREDELHGGLGLVWLLLGLPLLIPFVIQLLNRRSALLWTFLLPLALLFLLQPFRWWSRFTIALLAPALVAVVVFVDTGRSRALTLTVQALTLVFAAVAIWLGSSHVARWAGDYTVRDTVRLAARPASQRTLGKLFLPSFRWVDDAGPRAKIAVAIPVVVNRDQCPRGICVDLPFFYGLYGGHFRHRVYRLDARTRRGTLTWLRNHEIEYVYVARRSRYARWLAAERGFVRLYRDKRVVAYATPLARAHGAASRTGRPLES